jgi:hypothetical protein
MDNRICNFEVIHNPNNRYADTVNLVFFRAIPLTKNFQKYINGIRMWKHFKKHYPASQLQVFIDKSIASDSEIQKILHNLNARVILFECPEYMRKDGYHIGLFGTMVRFFPLFDINKHPLRVAHIQEVEPDPESVSKFDLIVSASKKNLQQYNTALIYSGSNLLNPEFTNTEFSVENLHYPWIFAGRFSVLQKIPFKVFTDFLHDIDHGKKFLNKYEINRNEEHKQYALGIDETFLNVPYLKYLIDNDYAIGIINEYSISKPIYWQRERIRENSHSEKFFRYILQKELPLREAMKTFDTLFYRGIYSEYASKCAKRFYEVVERYPTWLGKSITDMILKLYKGYLRRSICIIVRKNKIVTVLDL